ncbi:hypothetical protein JW698_03030 [Candidatus Wolfebacteria bacterium]|nr:hypothetical protein [Candidatus Wolfebacteria bacterium]
MKKFLHWFPRVFSILFILFMSMFALDVFGQPQWFLALIMHLIPSFILIILTVIAWKKEKIGGWLFTIAGLFAIVFFGLESFIVYIPILIIAAALLYKSYFLK